MITKRQLTAFHEAGHAVVTLRLGYKVETVTIKRDKGNLGSAAITKHGGLTSDHIRIDLAGMIAESIIDPHTSFKDRCKQGGLTDWQRAREIARLLATFYEAKPDIILEELKNQTTALVKRNARVIARVALALLEQQTLSGDEVLRLGGRRKAAREPKTRARRRGRGATPAHASP